MRKPLWKEGAANSNQYKEETYKAPADFAQGVATQH
tara:strand:+ start:4285 stop:4392 length:108 start_codon:yes stop_codon:yes gene_type:complete